MSHTLESVYKSRDVRAGLLETLQMDLVGPGDQGELAWELLSEPPTRWYLTGFLTPIQAPVEQRFDQTSDEEIDGPAETGGLDDEAEPDKQASAAAGRRSLLPGSMGLSALVPHQTQTIQVTVRWGDYHPEPPPEVPQAPQAPEQRPEVVGEGSGGPADAVPSAQPAQVLDSRGSHDQSAGGSEPFYRRTPRMESVLVTLPADGDPPLSLAVPDSGGLQLIVTVRAAGVNRLPAGTRAVSVFLVNHRQQVPEAPYRAFAFQCELEMGCEEGWVARPDLRSWDGEEEWDQHVGDLQYRDVCEYAVGHGVSATWEEADGACTVVRSTWLPTAEVERVEPAPIAEVELGMETLGGMADGHEAAKHLLPLVQQYRAWVGAQRSGLATLSGQRKQTADQMLDEAMRAADRIEAGINLLVDRDVFESFKLANRAVAAAFRQRVAQESGDGDPARVEAPRWRPFQLAYLLMTLRGIVRPQEEDREVVDLLFFPTGGGKTEAYLALAAFTISLRRRRHVDSAGRPDVSSAGVSVLMRYTLRLLTLDQLGRAAGLICAMELERQRDPNLWGDRPFEIGLWVGQAATPNIMGGPADQSGRRPFTAYTKTKKFQRNSKEPSPIPLERCPWCGTRFEPSSFRLVPNNRPENLEVHCANHRCEFHGDRPLPIVAVDEPIYRRLPCFLIATVDKFASLPWTGETGMLFGKAQRYDTGGFYGPCHPDRGTPLPHGQLPPPDLIIQDELHLISGPLGTVAGLYEAAIEALCTRHDDGGAVRPKIIASTATVRRADSQIRALFGRERVAVFPPPGPDRRDSFFARVIPAADAPARLYLGVAAQGRSLKVVLLRAALALLSAGQRAWEQAAKQDIEPNPADPYMTLLGYFNSLRELGGTRRIVEDEVRTRLAEYESRRRLEPKEERFADREIQYEVVELTSRVSTNKVAEAKQRLAEDFRREDRVDVALATNMISVGLDIMRLGLMVVLGQPKSSAEYIQATSRVGRDRERPGLVVTLLNIHKPRDRSHYERFRAYHASFYRHVEAGSVTPFSPRALDRALPAVLASLFRHEDPRLTPPRGAQELLKLRKEMEKHVEVLCRRARLYRGDLSKSEREQLAGGVLQRCMELLDAWQVVARRAENEGSQIQYQREELSVPRRLIRDFLDPELEDLSKEERAFRANRSMRDVEPAVDLRVKSLNDWGDA